MASGGTEAFPELGKHCQHPDCNQLDFLPFHCDGCRKVFCLEHRSYKSHECPKSDHKSRKVVVCEACSTSIEITELNGKDEKRILERHEKSGACDPSKKKKPACPVKRCKEVLTFSNTSTCKTCQVKVCLRHRFPADHDCGKRPPVVATAAAANGWWNEKFLAAFRARSGSECGKDSSNPGSKSSPSSRTTPSVKAY